MLSRSVTLSGRDGKAASGDESIYDFGRTIYEAVVLPCSFGWLAGVLRLVPPLYLGGYKLMGEDD
jgi:hypothetical protein